MQCKLVHLVGLALDGCVQLLTHFPCTLCSSHRVHMDLLKYVIINGHSDPYHTFLLVISNRLFDPLSFSVHFKLTVVQNMNHIILYFSLKFFLLEGLLFPFFFFLILTMFFDIVNLEDLGIRSAGDSYFVLCFLCYVF